MYKWEDIKNTDIVLLTHKAFNKALPVPWLCKRIDEDSATLLSCSGILITLAFKELVFDDDCRYPTWLYRIENIYTKKDFEENISIHLTSNNAKERYFARWYYESFIKREK